MKRFKSSIPVDYFEAMYAADPDPWRFSSSPYERGKYAATLAALPGQHYRRALEVGCSIGVFTRHLAPRCDALVAADPVEGALAQARRRCSDLDHVSFVRCRAPDEWPTGSFDLIVLSEMVYYLDRDDIRALADRVRGSIVPGGDVVLVHWLGETHYPLTGDDATEAFTNASAAFATAVSQTRTQDYRLDVLHVPSRSSVRPDERHPTSGSAEPAFIQR